MTDHSKKYAYELFDYGRTLYFRKDYENALEILFLSDELENHYETYYYIYLCFKALNDSENALKYIRLCYEYINISETYSIIYARELIEHKEFEKAEKVLEHTVLMNEYSEDAEEMLAELKKSGRN